ncbi:hypothetical protein CAPTEDRAFT_207898 [Capitella teleta]|uniref:Uncharacterized protein n=1 Tax=Capitella teleta TaxID=283909 RepID=R7VKR0_CAPTE|nr:hypothetical protein CAPTEDRAFT_207898 [Capitella teleta]|eukprot:ELU17591.1 hypothetical protein CAPTEDRAFT_207898 [Capitella teleta]
MTSGDRRDVRWGFGGKWKRSSGEKKRHMKLRRVAEKRSLKVAICYLNLYHVAGVVEESDVDDKNAQPRTPNATSVERWEIGASDPQKSDIHLIEAEVDSGAGCNTFPLYVYKKIFGAAPMDRP